VEKDCAAHSLNGNPISANAECTTAGPRSSVHRQIDDEGSSLKDGTPTGLNRIVYLNSRTRL